MVEDKRAHERLDTLETAFTIHLEGHAVFEKAVLEIAGNTKEMVVLLQGIRGVRTLRDFLVWASPVVIAITAVCAWIYAVFLWVM